jgi:hypothetical protein
LWLWLQERGEQLKRREDGSELGKEDGPFYIWAIHGKRNATTTMSNNAVEAPQGALSAAIGDLWRSIRHGKATSVQWTPPWAFVIGLGTNFGLQGTHPCRSPVHFALYRWVQGCRWVQAYQWHQTDWKSDSVSICLCVFDRPPSYHFGLQGLGKSMGKLGNSKHLFM